ncbi:DNA-directed RNA polymeraseI andI subunit 14 [Giardia duodenalis]|uniref:DNA-directed RNA polymeraseI andI subunit 14 n=1 Tax=Giardia intestinalis TaxID=5741 RepID=V6TZU2_GIAIN|nr:DNA-directed RNA polymeraseI andI subunit 14 [Giardia intestinalis]
MPGHTSLTGSPAASLAAREGQEALVSTGSQGQPTLVSDIHSSARTQQHGRGET